MNMAHRSIKVVHLSMGNLGGGAARGAYNLHRGLLEMGIDSNIIISHQPVGPVAGDVHSLATTQSHLFAYRLLLHTERFISRVLCGRKSMNFSSGLVGSWVCKHPVLSNADIINLHWINAGFLGIRQLKKFNMPIVWTIRDFWPLTAGCHIPGDCDRFMSGCYNCPLFRKDYFSGLSSKIYKLKKVEISSLENMFPVAISPWVASKARACGMFDTRDITTIWNCIYLNEFYSFDKNESRRMLGLPNDRYWLSFGSLSINEKHKGLCLLKAALEYLLKSESSLKIGLIIFGRNGGPPFDVSGIEVRELGYIRDSKMLSHVYSASDAFLMPSLWDCFGKTIVESWACGRPVVCFDTSGPGCLVEHLVDGYKAKKFDIEDFSNGIRYILQNTIDFPGEKLVKKSQIFGHRNIAKRYVDFYHEILSISSCKS